MSSEVSLIFYIDNIDAAFVLDRSSAVESETPSVTKLSHNLTYPRQFHGLVQPHL